MSGSSSLERLSLEELFECGRYGRSGVAENDRGDLVSIYDVPRGLACNCVCPSCRRAMVARTKDDIKAAHFAHYGTSDSTCTSAGETALHMFAKQVANERRQIFLPELVEEVDFEQELVVRARRFSFDGATLEKRTGQIVPDVILTARGRPLIVEFKVTHECGQEKIAKIRDLNIGAIEIDLSEYRGTPLKDLKDGILFRAPRKWLHNPNSAAARNRAGARAHLRRAAVADEVAKISSCYQHPSVSSEPGNGVNEIVARKDGLGDLISIDVNGAGCFVVDQSEWQAFVLLIILGSQRSFQAGEIFAQLRERDWIAPWALNLSPDVEAGLRGTISNYLPPEEAVAAYLDELSNQRQIIRHWNGAFQASPDLRSMVGKAREIRQRPAKRFDEARAIVDALLSSLPVEEVVGFNFEAWADAPVGEGAISLRDAVKGADRQWQEFIRCLRGVGSSIRSRPTPEQDLFGLPLGGELMRSLEREAQDRADRIEHRRKMDAAAAEARVNGLRADAIFALGEKSTVWLDTADRRLGDLTPLAAAAIGEAELHAARDLLRGRIAEMRQAEAREKTRVLALEEVARFARQKLGDEKGGIWLMCFHPKLKARPIDFVSDRSSRDVCLRLIDPKVNIEKFDRGRAPGHLGV